MENSMSEIETHQSIRSPPRRRRSTFFERRDSIVLQINSENSDLNVKDTEDINRAAGQDLSKYYNNLLTEKEEWKREATHRKNRYNDLKQQYKITLEASNKSLMSYSALTSEDIEFLKAKPNLSKLIESQLTLHKSMERSRELYKRTQALDDVTLNYCEKQINQITDHILDNSTLEPMDCN